MTVSLEFGIRDLFPEFLAHALVFFCPLQSAGAVTAGALQSVTDDFNHFLIFVETYGHVLVLLISVWGLMKMPHPTTDGALSGGECEIRTHGASPHHQFSRLAP